MSGPKVDYTTELLVDRGKTHGDYQHRSVLAQELKRKLREEDGWTRLNSPQRQSLEMICDKISRIMCGDPFHKDSWEDISGYAKLISERL